MPRKPRIYLNYGFYHVFNRGVERRKIFNNERDYEQFLNKLKALTQESDFSVYCYTLLPNHFHISLETRKTTLSKILGRLLTSYAVYFNKKYNRVGPLFQDRFKSILVQKDNYFLQLSCYIHLNSVEAGIVTDPLDYPYSSFAELFDRSRWNIVDKEAVRRLIGKTKADLEQYRRFVYERIDKDNTEFNPFYSGKDILGTEFFNTSSQRKFLRRINR